MEIETVLSKMEKDDNLRYERNMVLMIRAHLMYCKKIRLQDGPKKFLQEANHYQLHSVILEFMGFSESEIENVIEIWYLERVIEILKNPGSVFPGRIASTALQFYYIIKEKRRELHKSVR